MKGIDCTTAITATKAKELASQGIGFVCRYLVPERLAWKRLTRAEAEAISAAGMQVVSVFETTANRPRGGAAAGEVDGREALHEAQLIGQPFGSAIYFAVDYDAGPEDYDAIEAYLRAAAAELIDYLVGVYGSYSVCKAMYERNACRHLWQTYAWSSGNFTPHANIHQYQNGKMLAGIEVDYNESYGGEGWWNTNPGGDKMYKPTIQKERIYAENGRLVRCDGDYKKSATDVHWLKLDKDRIRIQVVHEPGAKVSQLVKKYGADLGTNFPFFHEDGYLYGDVVSDSKVVRTSEDSLKTYFGVKDGKPVIGKRPDLDQFEQLVEGKPLLLEPIDGQASPCYAYYREHQNVAGDIANSADTVRCQRTFYGIDAAGDLIIAVADGRTQWDQGLNLQEMTLFMQSKGAMWALPGDGGGSSIIADESGGLNQAENTGVNERTVNHAVLFYFVDETNLGQWKKDAMDWLRDNGYITGDHDPDEPLTMALFGAMMKNKKEVK